MGFVHTQASLPRKTKATQGGAGIWLHAMLVHWGADGGAADDSATLASATWKLCHTDWGDLGQGRHAKALRWWAAQFNSVVLRDKIRVIMLYRQTSRIAQSAHQHDSRDALASWTSWLQGGNAKGLGRQHRMSRVASG